MKKTLLKKLSLFLVAMFMIISISACGGSTETTEEGGETRGESSGETIKIAYITPSLDLPFWRYLANGIENKVIDLGMNAEVQIYDSKNSSETQLQNAQDIAVKGADIIILSPTDSSSAPPVLALAEESEIPVVIADIGTDSGTFESFVITPNAEGSEELGKYAMEYMKANGMEGKAAAQITGPLARNNINARYEGFNASLEAAGVELSDYKQMEKFTRAEAEGIAQDLMTTYQDLGIIFCHMDEPTLGVMTAVEGAGKKDDVLVVGFDGTPETITEIENGNILAAAIQQPALMGAHSVEIANAILNGEEFEKQIDVPTLLVTKENVKDEAIVEQLERDVFPESKMK